MTVQGNVDNRSLGVQQELRRITEPSFSKVIRDVHADLPPKQSVEMIRRKTGIGCNIREGQLLLQMLLHVRDALLDNTLGTQGQALLCY